MTETADKGRTRLLFLAVDAADRDLILGWAREGVLPTFRSLLDTSAWMETTNPVGFVVGALWPSFWTGLDVDRHGRYCYTQFRTGTYDHYNVSPTETVGKPFWDSLCESGCRVAIVDVPKTVPSSRIDGIQVVDWGTHDPELGFSTVPESLADEIQSRFGAHAVDQCDAFMKRGAAEYVDLRNALVAGVEQKAKLVEYLFDRGDWDLFLAVFAESHCVGHHCWHLHDRTHARWDPELARSVGDPIRDVYVAIDAALGRLIERAGPETTVLVLASHGMGPHYDGTFLLDRILRRLLDPEPPPESKRKLARFLEAVWHAIPAPLQAPLRAARGRTKNALGFAATIPELSLRKCFSTPNNDVYGGIRINLAGREPNGLIQPGADYDAFCDSLSADLLAFVNADTGKPLIKRVLRTDRIYRGERVRDLPDLLVEWERAVPITRVHSPKTGLIEGVFPGIRTGDHKNEGVLFARGPGIAPGRVERTAAVTQIAATVASLLGVPPPADVGPPIAELSPSPEPAGR